MARTLVYLVRHGEQAASEAGASGLSDLGREQAHALGQRLSGVPFARAHHSPLRRATETASILTSYLPGVVIHACEFVRDRTPMPSATKADEMYERHSAFFAAVPDDERDHGGVGLQAAIEHIGQAGAEDRYELVVTHNFVIGWFVRHVLDAPQWRWIGLNQFNCGLTILQWRPDHPPTLISYNDIGHLPAHLRGQVPLDLPS